MEATGRHLQHVLPSVLLVALWSWEVLQRCRLLALSDPLPRALLWEQEVHLEVLLALLRVPTVQLGKMLSALLYVEQEVRRQRGLRR
jgi:hypothetical protein